MRRKYTVWVGGKPVEFSTAAPGSNVRDGWLLVNLRDGAAMDKALEALARPEVEGLFLWSAHGLDPWGLFQARHRFVAAAGGAVQDEHGRLLVMRRRGHWDLPKGKLDDGEDSAAAALREVREECGLQRLRIIGPLPETWHTYELKGIRWLKRTDWFRMQGSAGEELVPQHEEDIGELRWAAREELPAIINGSYPSLRPVFEAWMAARAEEEGSA